MVFRAGVFGASADPDSGKTGKSFYVAVDGKASHDGTVDSPWDIESALGGGHAIPPGSTVYLKGGTYRHADRRWESPGFAIELAGAPGQPVHIRPVPGQRVTLDGKVEVKPGARHLWVWELEITVSETAGWNRRVTAGGLKADGADDLPQGGLNIVGGADSKFIHLVVHDMNNGRPRTRRSMGVLFMESARSARTGIMDRAYTRRMRRARRHLRTTLFLGITPRRFRHTGAAVPR
jgi:hypothetical protein